MTASYKTRVRTSKVKGRNSGETIANVRKWLIRAYGLLEEDSVKVALDPQARVATCTINLGETGGSHRTGTRYQLVRGI